MRAFPGKSAVSLAAAAALLLAGLFLSAEPGLAGPVRPGATFDLSQPDGAGIEARPFGDEWYHGFETRSGYTLLRDRNSGEWRYARAKPDGSLEAGEADATAPPPTGLEPHLRDRLRASAAEGAASATGPLALPAVPRSLYRTSAVGEQPVLVILAEYTNSPSLGTTPGEWAKRFFGGSGSVADYYRQGSGGQLDLVPADETHGDTDDGVIGWVSLPRPHPMRDGPEVRAAARDAIEAADPWVDFAAYDRDGNGWISADELHVIVVAAGYDFTAGCGSNPERSLWPHRWALGNLAAEVDGIWVGGRAGDSGGGYIGMGEIQCVSGSAPSMSTIGVPVHELGHDFDLPDLYAKAGMRDFVGPWSPMATGMWAAGPDRLPGQDPVGFDAFSRTYLGWTFPQQVDGEADLTAAAESLAVIRLGGNPLGVDWSNLLRSGTGEYFLAENRQPTGNDVGLPGCGVLIWHVDEARPPWGNGSVAEPERPMLRLVEADNGNQPGGPGDIFLGRDFDDDTVPAAHYYGDRPSGLSVRDIPADCAPAMTVTWGNDPPAPPANDDFGSAVELAGTEAVREDDDTTAATREAGEPNHAGDPGGRSIWYRWTPEVDGDASLSTTGSGFDTTLAVYTGSRPDSLAPVAASDDLIWPSVFQSGLHFRAEAGTTYRIAVDGHRGPAGPAAGRVRLTLEQVPESQQPEVPGTPESPRPLEPLRYRVEGSGTGVIRITGREDCASDCGLDLPHGSVIELDAKPGPGAVFSGWSGACSGTGRCRITMSGPRYAIAGFTLPAATRPPETDRCRRVRMRVDRLRRLVWRARAARMRASDRRTRRQRARVVHRRVRRLRRARALKRSVCRGKLPPVSVSP